MSEMLLTTHEVAELMGVGPTSVKRWADSGRLHCVRTAGGHRRFNRSEVDRFVDGQQLSPAGPASVQHWVRLLRQGPDVHHVQARLLAMRASLGSWAKTADAFGTVLQHLDTHLADDEIERLQECAASEQVHRALAQLTGTLPVPVNAPICLLATVCDDAHTLGLSLGELTAREAGWNTLWFGPAARLTELEAYVEAKPTEVLALSASRWSDNPSMLSEWLDRVGTACTRRGVHLIFGGSGAWPEHTTHGRRLERFDAFSQALHALGR